MRPLDIDNVAQTVDEKFDLVVATNVLVYYGRFQQALAMASVAHMMNAGGIYLANHVLPARHPDALQYLGRRTVNYSLSEPLATTSSSTVAADLVSTHRLRKQLAAYPDNLWGRASSWPCRRGAWGWARRPTPTGLWPGGLFMSYWVHHGIVEAAPKTTTTRFRRFHCWGP